MTIEQKKSLFFRYLTYFLAFSFVGWVFETSAVYFISGELTDRGYFFVGSRLTSNLPFLKIALPRIIWGLPAIEMYGIGGLIIVITLKKYHNHIVKIFFYGFIIMSIFELLGSYWCTEVLRHSYWNYNHEFLNFQGRICLQSSIAWGVLSVVVIQFIEPFLEKFYNKIEDYKHTKKILIFLGVYIIICALVKYVLFPGIIPH